ncbi:MAG: hypothetical protein E6Q97_29240 [Desulfurellales bacterium]|nr:MAG: hypothetical protein E6Q97_29240 [Desulfurellales bacterium]
MSIFCKLTDAQYKRLMNWISWAKGGRSYAYVSPMHVLMKRFVPQQSPIYTVDIKDAELIEDTVKGMPEKSRLIIRHSFISPANAPHILRREVGVMPSQLPLSIRQVADDIEYKITKSCNRP